MKKISQMYMCYLDDGRNYIYSNPHYGRAESDETKVVLSEGVEIVTMQSGDKMLKYKRGYYPDNALYTKETKVYIHTYQRGDVDGEPTGAPVMVAEMVEG